MPVGTSTGLFFEDESDYQLHLMGGFKQPITDEKEDANDTDVESKEQT